MPRTDATAEAKQPTKSQATEPRAALNPSATEVEGLINELTSNDQARFNVAALRLATLGTEARGAVNALAAIVGKRAGGEIVSRALAAVALGRIGADAKEAIPLLRTIIQTVALDDPEENKNLYTFAHLREAAFAAICKIDPAQQKHPEYHAQQDSLARPGQVELLIGRLTSNNLGPARREMGQSDEIEMASLELALIGRAATAAAPALAAVVDKRAGWGATVRSHAVLALGRIGGGAKQFIPLLTAVTQEEAPPDSTAPKLNVIAHELLREVAFAAIKRIEFAGPAKAGVQTKQVAWTAPPGFSERDAIQRARTSLGGEDEEFAKELVRLMAIIYEGRKKQWLGAEGTKEWELSRKIGARLNADGGFHRMLLVYHRMRFLRNGDDGCLQHVWHNIGSWQT